MIDSRMRWFLLAGALALAAPGAGWKSKPMPEWTEDDARQIITDSPWAKVLKVPVTHLEGEDQRRDGGKMGQDHGIGYDGLLDDRHKEKLPTSVGDLVKPETITRPTQLLTVQLRWESALPMRVAELKSHTVEPPTLGGDGYALAVYGIPNAHVKGEPEQLGEPLKRFAVLKREGKKDVKPARVEVFARPDGAVIVYLFPPSAEISKADGVFEFSATIGRVVINQSFNTGEMQFQGKLEL
jgi:hypothetical protein